MAEPATAPSTIDLNDPAYKALVDHRVATETASLRSERDAAVKERDEARTRIDVLEAEKSAAEQARDAATTERDQLKVEVETERSSAGRREARKTALREVAAHLSDEWFAAEVAHGEAKMPRLEKIARMSDEEFDGYKAELASTFEGVTVAPVAGGQSSTTTIPRETAMAGQSGVGGTQERASRRHLAQVSAFGGRRIG